MLRRAITRRRRSGRCQGSCATTASTPSACSLSSPPRPSSASSAGAPGAPPPTAPAAPTPAPVTPPHPPRRHNRPSHLPPAHPRRRRRPRRLLDLTVQLGHLLRRRGQAARGLTLVLKFAGGTTWEKTRRLPEPSAHDDDLRTLAYRLMDAAGLQRGRLTGLALKGEDLVDADQVAEQISLDDTREARLVAEAAVDRVRDKFGVGVIGPAAVFRCAS
ncbi:DinB/UmuC family translesion DNA polymerase [Streptomyces rishiriensis]|uniref:DinB/UmuC family translesion DNA polymerase n=1 Tax=Streptomyces rishiriensis TaxID=68264 RepID=UPI0037D40EF8